MAPKIEFENVDSYFSDIHPHLMIYGRNGVGKTTLAGGSGLRTVHFDCQDAGVVTLKKVKHKNVRVVRIKSTDHYLDVIANVNDRADNLDLIVADTLTGLQSLAIRKVKGKGDMNMRKWGQVSSMVIECIAETRLFTKDVMYLAQERRKKQGGDDALVGDDIFPSLTPSIREFLSGNIDWVGRIYMEGERRKLSFILTEHVEAKDRAGIFPKIITLPEIDVPVYPRIRQRIIEGLK